MGTIGGTYQGTFDFSTSKTKKGRSRTFDFSTTKRHEDQIVELARQLIALGFNLLATSGTAKCIPVQRVKKIAEGHRNLIDDLKNEDVTLIIITPSGKGCCENGRRLHPGSRRPAWRALYHED